MTNELMQFGMFEAESTIGDNDEIIISAEWAALPDDDFEQIAAERHKELDQQEAVIDAFKNLIIRAKGELYIAAKARLKHGRYLKLLEKMGVSPDTAQGYAKLARDHGEELSNAERVRHLSLRQWIRISRSPESHQIIGKLESGDIPATQDAINTELEAAKQRTKELEEANKQLQGQFDLFKEQTEQEREKEREDAQRDLDIKVKELDLYKWQKQLQDSQHEAQQKQLQEDIDRLKQEKVQTIKEDTPETKAKLEEVERQLKEIEAQKQKLADDKKEQDSQLKQKTDRVKELTKQINTYNAVNRQEKHNEKIRAKCRQMCEAYAQGRSLASTRMVTAIDAQHSFGQEEWAMIAEEEAGLRRAADELAQLRQSVTSQFIDATPIVESPLAYIEAGGHAL